MKIGSTIDNDDQFESEMFENRQLFLNYYPVNNCQFDEFRRAKFSTIMVLYQFHNTHVPKFVRQFGACQRDLCNVRSQHRCEVCTDFDLYLDCFSLIKKKSRICKSSRYVHHKSHTFSLFKCIPANNSRCVPVNNVSHTVQADRKKTLQEYLKILNHAAYCVAAYHLDVK